MLLLKLLSCCFITTTIITIAKFNYFLTISFQQRIVEITATESTNSTAASGPKINATVF